MHRPDQHIHVTVQLIYDWGCPGARDEPMVDVLKVSFQKKLIKDAG